MGVGPPSGTVTFLFTDVEGSTRLWDRYPKAMRAALVTHDGVVRSAIEAHGGYVFSTGGDGFGAAFWTARAAVAAAVEAQRRLGAERWEEPLVVRVRMGIHTGVADEREGDYFGSAVNRAARLMGAAAGGQVLVSAAVERLLDAGDEADWTLIEVGELSLRDLALPERVYRVVADGLSSVAPPSMVVHRGVQDLLRRSTSLIGRSGDLERVGAALRARAIVTLVGPGGVGKTSLALQAGADVADNFDGVHLADLAPITDPDAVAARLMEASGHVASGLSRDDVDDALVGRVGWRHLLFIFDNCEHLVAECARLAALLVDRCPRVVILATSRQPLGAVGEQVVLVGPLTVPLRSPEPAQVRASAAGALFVERAQRVRPGFDVTDDNAASVADICWQVEGLPLALELAAARVRAMTPEAIARRLRESSRLLNDGPRTGDPRHRSLDACLRWSFDTLSADEATVMRRLSVFAGGATLDAASAVCAGAELDRGDVDDVLVSLVDKSLVLTEERGNDLRYRLHELVRHFAAARLAEAGESDAAQGGHLGWCTDLVRRVSPGLRSATTLDAVDPLLPEADNLAAAVAFALRHRDAVALTRLLGGAGEMWAHVGRMRQLAQWWDALLPLIPEVPNSEFPPNRLTLTLASAVAAQLNVGRYADAHALAQRAKVIPGAPSDAIAFVEWLEAALAGFRDTEPAFVIDILDALTAKSATGGLVTETPSACLLAIWLVLTGDARRVPAVVEDVLTGDDEATAMWRPTAAATLAVADVLDRRQDDGLEALDRICADASTRTTHWRYVVYWLGALGHLLATSPKGSDEAMRRALIEARDASFYWTMSWAVETAALHCIRRGDHDLATRVLVGLDAELAQTGGCSLSARPTTILHTIRCSLPTTADQTLPALPLNPTTATDRLLRHLG